ncbi:MAG: PH domain-containing protein [Candidatus Paceibacterota bacterium]|jgi:uncharacterized membrane protein YdbT with pleckstrin-like domain
MKNIKKFLSKTANWRSRNKKFQSLFIGASFLLPKERIIFKTNPHWLCVVVPEISLALSGLLILHYISYPSGQFPYLYSHWLLVFFEVALVFIMIVFLFQWLGIKYCLTNLRLIEERGIIGKRIMSIWLEKVEDLACKFGILGRIFGFGDIEIESAGTEGKIIFSFLPAPRKLKQKIEEAIKELELSIKD